MHRVYVLLLLREGVIANLPWLVQVIIVNSVAAQCFSSELSSDHGAPHRRPFDRGVGLDHHLSAFHAGPVLFGSLFVIQNDQGFALGLEVWTEGYEGNAQMHIQICIGREGCIERVALRELPARVRVCAACTFYVGALPGES